MPKCKSCQCFESVRKKGGVEKGTSRMQKSKKVGMGVLLFSFNKGKWKRGWSFAYTYTKERRDTRDTQKRINGDERWVTQQAIPISKIHER